MVVTISQAQLPIIKYSNLSIYQQVHMDDPVVNYIISPFEVNINPGDPQGTKTYLQATKDVGVVPAPDEKNYLEAITITH